MTEPAPEPQAPQNYRLQVTDFGPIAEADVEMRPLTVFVGPSNTGKSYLAILNYALHRCFSAPNPGLHPWEMQHRWTPFFFYALAQLDAATRQSLESWLLEAGLQVASAPALPAKVADYLRSVLERANGLDGYVEQEIRRCFGLDVGVQQLIRRQASGRDTRMSLSVPRPDRGGMVHYELQLCDGGVEVSGKIDEIEAVVAGIADISDIGWLHLRQLLAARPIPSNDHELGYLLDRLCEQVMRPLHQDAYYLPADRAGVIHNHRLMVTTLVQRVTAGLTPSANIPMLSGVLADFLERLIGLGDARGLRQQPSEPANRLERNILEGEVLLEHSEAGYPVFAYRPTGWEDALPLMRASSMVSELLPVVLYIRYIVQPGDTLIIEEPEAHLHPAMQRAFTRELAYLVNSGVRIVMTTHSEWFLEQIGNLVRLSGLPKAGRAALGGEDVALHATDVGAWLFKPGGQGEGSIVKEVKLDPETGLFPTDYDMVSDTLYNESARISNWTQEGEDG